MKRKRSKLVPTLVVFFILAGGAWYAMASGGESEVAEIQGATVQRGPLRISVVERGDLEAAESVTLKSEVEGSTTILYLIDEGTVVKPGDLLCELDTSSLVDRRVQQEIQVQNALASLTKAEQNHQIQISQNESDIAAAKQDRDFAQLDLVKYREGDKPQAIKQAEEDILLREEELNRAEEEYAWSQKLAEKGFLENTQLETDRLAMTRASIALEQARRAMDLLTQYEIPRTESELSAAVEESEREYQRVELQAKARLADYEADLATSRAKYDLESSDLEKLVDQIEKALIHSPVSGMVVYAMENRGRFGGGEPIQEGTQVRERQEIITIPSEKGYVAEASLHESVLEKVDTGMPCLVTVDALRKTLRGRVTFKAVLPDQQSWWANPDLRVYRTRVEILDEEPRMRPGMSCSIEILVDDIPDALFMPVQAVFLDAGEPVAFVPGVDGPEKRALEVGQNNGKWVEVLSGLTEGDTVLLSLPAGANLAPATEEAVPGDTEDWPEATGAGAQEGGAPTARAEDAGGEGGEQRGGFDPARMEAWRKANPEQAKALEEAMKDPEKRKEMMERFQRARGGAAGPGGSGGPGGGGRPVGGE